MNEPMTSTDESAEQADPIRAAQTVLKQNRRQGLAKLNELFRSGAPPAPPLDGPYDGELVAVDIAPGVTQITGWLTSLRMPWKGKHLSADKSLGDNIFGRRSRGSFRLMFPLYRGVKEEGEDTFRAFVFKTSVGPGRLDADRQVLKIDYDSPDNPAQSIRRILDEVVQLDAGVYLGKIHFRWWGGRWQLIGYFALRARQ